MTLSETGHVLLVLAMWALTIGSILGFVYVESENRILRAIMADVP